MIYNVVRNKNMFVKFVVLDYIELKKKLYIIVFLCSIDIILDIT